MLKFIFKNRFSSYFIKGLNLLDLVDRFRDSEDEELLIQCDVFFDEKQNDDDELGLENQMIDINSHQQVFNAVFQKVRIILRIYLNKE